MLFENQKVNIEKKDNFHLIKPLQFKSTPGVFIKFKPTKNKNYTVELTYGKFAGDIRLWISDAKTKKVIIYNKNINLDTDHTFIKVILNTEYEEVNIGALFTAPKENHFFELVDINVSETHIPNEKRLAIIVPYRDRMKHLEQFMSHMNTFLKDFDYQIFIIHQKNKNPFNRAGLFNIGFDIVKDHFDFFCFHDVDLLPIGSSYEYPNVPTHLSYWVSQFDYEKRDRVYGGVLNINKEQFIKLNGFSNEFKGWGGEDDDFYYRMITEYEPIHVYGFYKSLPHPHIGKKKNPNYGHNYRRFDRMRKNKNVMYKDGLNTIGKKFKYKIQQINKINNDCSYQESNIDYKKGINYMIDVNF